jgi:hypothetical protein
VQPIRLAILALVLFGVLLGTFANRASPTVDTGAQATGTGLYEVVVRGPVALRSLHSEHASLLDFAHIVLMEFTEAAAATFARLAITDPVGGYMGSFVCMALADFVYGLFRSRAGESHYAYYMADDTGAEVGYFVSVFRRQATDAVFYTLMLFAWTYALTPSDSDLGTYIFGVAWVLRNVGFRITRWFVWEKILKGNYRMVRPDNRRPITLYGDEEYHNVYISEDRQHQVFVWDWRAGNREIDNFAELLGIRENYLDTYVFNDANSWEEFREELFRPRQLVAPTITDSDDESKSSNEREPTIHGGYNRVNPDDDLP